MAASYVLTVACESTRGIIAAISTYLAEMKCNITDSSQFDDAVTGSFFMRVSFDSEGGVLKDELSEKFQPIAEQFGMEAEFHDLSVRPKVVIMVSRFGHCLNDILYRWRIGALKIDIVAVVSNHLDYQKVYSVNLKKESDARW